jgi:hypothetical protein
MATAVPSIVGEFEGVNLGDKRLDRRLRLIAAALDEEPELSLPDIFDDDAELEAGYRFFGNSRVTLEGILRPHVAATGRRLAAHKVALAVSDTTELAFTGRAARQGLEGDRFRAHFTLAVSADGRRESLGVLAIRPWVRAPKDDKAKAKKPSTEQRREDENRESKRWLAQSIAVEEAVPEGVQLIHVEDREADIFDSMYERKERGMRFIIRAQRGRAIDLDGDRGNILEHLRSQEVLFERDVHLSRRQTQGRPPKDTYGDRDGRRAKLAIRAKSVVLLPPRVDMPGLYKPITVNAVHVVELEPPEGEPPVEWLLVTTEPIGTQDEIAFVIDSYRARWVIEEYFKALKTGCAYEMRQLESYDALLRLLSVFSVVAWRLMWMRFLAHHAPEKTPATVIAAPAELAFLVADGRLKRSATAKEFLIAVAKMGGHIKHNGPPGWQVLWRGYRKLRDRAEGFALAREM